MCFTCLFSSVSYQAIFSSFLTCLGSLRKKSISPEKVFFTVFAKWDGTNINNVMMKWWIFTFILFMHTHTHSHTRTPYFILFSTLLVVYGVHRKFPNTLLSFFFCFLLWRLKEFRREFTYFLQDLQVFLKEHSKERKMDIEFFYDDELKKALYCGLPLKP